VALLSNTEAYSRTSFISEYVPINPDMLYLQAGWVKSKKGNGCLGRRWKGNIAEEIRPFSYVVAGIASEDWQHYAAVVSPPEGANHAQIWMLNFRSKGRVYFDDVWFMEIERPGK
jgi:hypothetical protein